MIKITAYRIWFLYVFFINSFSYFQNIFNCNIRSEKTLVKRYPMKPSSPRITPKLKKKNNNQIMNITKMRRVVINQTRNADLIGPISTTRLLCKNWWVLSFSFLSLDISRAFKLFDWCHSTVRFTEWLKCFPCFF